MGVKLSILVPSVHTRWDGFARRLIGDLFAQYEALPPAEQASVEIIVLTDTKSLLLGDKRNDLVKMAKGQYVVFVDDDDRVEPDYVSTLLAATEHGADVITFLVSVSLNGGAPLPCRYSMHFKRDENTDTEYQRLPNHICAVKRELAVQTPYPPVFCGEDKQYGLDLHPKLQSEHAIDRVLYHYDYNVATTETQVAKRTPVQTPILDVVILSKASTDAARDMTQTAVSTCRKGAAGYLINIIVIEQVEGVSYRDAVTVHEGGTFAYNKFANMGARMGSAPWLMIANNDLRFERRWLRELLAANHPVVSPLAPGDRRQARVAGNETGTTNGQHFSGWCFMLSRSLWERIGGFDEDFSFWCADDSVIEQLKAVNVQPMIVPRARVQHLGSVTLQAMPVDEEMTWGQVLKFERKYGVQKFADDPRYIAYKARMG